MPPVSSRTTSRSVPSITLGAAAARRRSAPGSASPAAGSRTGRGPCGARAGPARDGARRGRSCPTSGRRRRRAGRRRESVQAASTSSRQRDAVRVDRGAADQPLVVAEARRARRAARPRPRRSRGRSRRRAGATIFFGSLIGPGSLAAVGGSAGVDVEPDVVEHAVRAPGRVDVVDERLAQLLGQRARWAPRQTLPMNSRGSSGCARAGRSRHSISVKPAAASLRRGLLGPAKYRSCGSARDARRRLTRRHAVGDPQRRPRRCPLPRTAPDPAAGPQPPRDAGRARRGR